MQMYTLDLTSAHDCIPTKCRSDSCRWSQTRGAASFITLAAASLKKSCHCWVGNFFSAALAPFKRNWDFNGKLFALFFQPESKWRLWQLTEAPSSKSIQNCICDKCWWRLADEQSRAVLVAQGCTWSCCTPTLLDTQALGNVASDFKCGFSDLCYVPQSIGYQ